MARQARDKTTFGTYYIHQHSNATRHLFKDDKDREKFLSILEKTKSKFDFKLYAYCLKDSDAYHLILFDNGGDISKIMKSINISYAMYAKSDQPLFKDRYKSTRLNDLQAFTNTTQALKESSGSSPWNGYCLGSNNEITPHSLLDPMAFSNLVDGLANNKNIEALNPEEMPLCPDSPNCIECMDEAESKLEERCSQKGMSVAEMLNDKTVRNQLIRHIRQNSTLSLKNIGVLFGGLSESTICKILNQ